MQKRRLRALLAGPLLAAALFAAPANDYIRLFGQPSFVFRIYQFPPTAGDSAMVQFHIGLVNDVLQFIRQENGRFLARYEVALSILAAKQQLLFSRILDRELEVASFQETNSRDSLNHEQFECRLPPGEYRILLDIMDRDTRKHLKRQRKLEIPAAVAGQFAASSILFYESPSTAYEKQLNLPNIFTEPSHHIWAEFEVAGLGTTDSLHLEYFLFDHKNRRLAGWRQTVLPDAGRRRLVQNVGRYLTSSGKLIFQFHARQGTNAVSGQEAFVVRFAPVSAAEQDSLLAPENWEALRYIAPAEVFEQIAAAESHKRQTLIAAFWAARNPDRRTGSNPLEDEFNRRVDFANLHFALPGDNRPGWETDRGRIYLKYGEPDWVKSESAELDITPIEVWYYKRLDTRFFFRDKQGDGDFKLFYQE